MLLIGQSLEFHREPLAAALRARDAAPIIARAETQLAAGADALDLNAGVGGAAIDLAWIAEAIRPATYGRPLFLDTASPATIALAFELCEREGVPRPLAANALPVGGPPGSVDDDAVAGLLRAVVRARAALVVSPRLVDGGGEAAASAQAVVDAAVAGAIRAREAGLNEPLYLDALTYPALIDPDGCRRSLAVLRLLRAVPNVERLAAVGNAGAAAPAALAAALRVVYAAAATGAGATALLLPVEEPAVVRAVRVAGHALPPATAEERWLLELADAVARDAPTPKPPLTLMEAARAIFVPLG
ncbi:MAG: hypothetical protein EXR64_01220 [Dehalococcoidia bacterium]|nr:hypothetical protein [Dehalococcoidia bacterium]